MFVPIPIVIVVGLIFVLMLAQIVRSSRRPDPLLGAPSPTFRPAPALDRTDLPVAPTATLPPEVDAQVRALIQAGRKIDAVKLVRDVTRLGLKDSKELVEAL